MEPRRTILVTGASGFTGPYVIDTLRAQGYHVVGLARRGDTAASHDVDVDLTDAGAVAKVVKDIRPTHVLHLAGMSSVDHDVVADFYRVNLFGTLNLLDALVGLPDPARVLVASSANVYGATARGLVSEDVCPAPVNHYATSKLAMEHMVATYYDRLPIVIARPFNYTGVGQSTRFLIPKIVAHFRAGCDAIELGNLDVSRDFSDVRDVAACYDALLAAGAHSCVVNICSGRAVALRALIDILQRLAGYEIEVRVNSDFVRKNEIPVLRGCRDRLARFADHMPVPRPIEETLAWMYQAEVVL